jgi:hypothetical protein
LILALACVACLTEIAADIGTALRALANAKIHSNATPSQYFNTLLAVSSLWLLVKPLAGALAALNAAGKKFELFLKCRSSKSLRKNHEHSKA